MQRTLLLVVVAGFATSLSLADEKQWAEWRGPTGNGVAPKAKPPLEWSPDSGIRWKVELPGKGSATPIIWGDQIFIAAAVTTKAATFQDEPRGRRGRGGRDRRGRDRGGRGGRGRGRGGRGRGGAPTSPVEFRLLSLDRKTGKTQWDEVAATTTPHEGTHRDHDYASASPCTDGKLVFAHFGTRGLFAYTLEGKLVWKRTDLGKMTTRGTFGEGSSPTLHDDRLIVPWDHEGDSYIAALDKKTGKTIWKTERDEPTSWATPLVVEHKGKKQIIASGQNFARGYDFKTGKEIWRCSGQTGRPVASPVAADGMVFIGSGFRGAFLGAFHLGHKGDLEGTKGVAWSIDRHTPDIPSPLLSDGRLYFHAGRSGILSCYDAKSGKPHYQTQRVAGLSNVYASPIAANGGVYLTARDGTTVVIKDADKFEILATNSVGEPVDATPAAVGSELFVRGSRHLFCIGAGD